MQRVSNRSLAGIAVAVTWALFPPVLQAGPEQDRTISFYHIHSKESLTVTYKKSGTYDKAALKKIDWLMRDWREDTATKIDPRSIDILWEMHTELGSKVPIHIICGHRSRKTNNMLRRTRGGQARNSLHISGKAIDAAFPDVPVRQVRYSALIRQRGGVGYYPTSAIPFVHVDSGRVRHWPKINRDELALLFPSGHSKHIPRGGRLRPSDVKRARNRRKDLAIKVAAFHDLRKGVKTPTYVADAGDIIVPPKPVAAVQPTPKPQKPTTFAAGPPSANPADDWSVEIRPNLKVAAVSPPRAVERLSTFTPRPSSTDRARLNQLIAQATFIPLRAPPQLIRAPKTIEEAIATPSPAAAPPDGSDAVAGNQNQSSLPISVANNAGLADRTERFDWAQGLVAAIDDTVWAQSPQYDDDHPDELAYRPFPIEPFMTPTLNDPSFARLTKPDNSKTLAFLDTAGTVAPMRLRPPQQVAHLMWRQEFKGDAVQIYDAEAQTSTDIRQPNSINTRQVSTSNQ